MTNIKTFVDYKPLNEIRTSLNMRNCFKNCYYCNLPWNKTKTINVHMLSGILNGRSETRFACDGCVLGN